MSLFECKEVFETVSLYSNVFFITISCEGNIALEPEFEAGDDFGQTPTPCDIFMSSVLQSTVFALVELRCPHKTGCAFSKQALFR